MAGTESSTRSNHKICGCIITCLGDNEHELSITYCPRHEAALDMLDALKKIAAHLESGLEDFSHESECEVDEAGDGCTCVVNGRVWEPLRKAERIASALLARLG